MNHTTATYTLPYLPADRAWSWVLTCDPNKAHGALLTAIDHLDNWVVVGEHFAEGWPDGEHAKAYRQMLAAWKLVPNRDVAIYADPGGAGAQAIINMAEVGIFCTPVPKDAGSVKASIERIRRAAWIDPEHPHPLAAIAGVRDDPQWAHCWHKMGAPHLYFLTSLRSQWVRDGVQYNESRLFYELRSYRQKENGKLDEPVKEDDHLVDCLRYVALVRPVMAAPPDLALERERAQLDPLSRRAAEEYDELVKPKKPKVFAPL